MMKQIPTLFIPPGFRAGSNDLLHRVVVPGFRAGRRDGQGHLVNPFRGIQRFTIDASNTSPKLPKEVIFLNGLGGNCASENPDISFSERNIHSQRDMVRPANEITPKGGKKEAIAGFIQEASKHQINDGWA
jgi:hypothetical protein